MAQQRFPGNFLSKFLTINAEPSLLLYSIAIGVFLSEFQAFIYFRECVDVVASGVVTSIDEEYCRELRHNQSLFDDYVQKRVTYFFELTQISYALPSIFVSSFYGAWSDLYGRKGPLLISISGGLFMYFMLIFSSTFIATPSFVILIVCFVAGFSGQFLVCLMSCFASIRDLIRDSKELTFRIAIASSLITIGIVIGSLTSAQTYQRFGYGGVFVIAFASMAASFIYSLLCFRETLELIPGNATSPQIDIDFSRIQADRKEILGSLTASESIRTKIRRLISPYRVKEAWMTILIRRDQNRRLYILLGMAAFLLLFSSDIGMPGIVILFVKHPPLDWSDAKFSYFTAANAACSTAGMVFLIAMLKKLLGLPDTVLIVWSLAWAIVIKLVLALSTFDWMVFLSGALSFFSSLGYPAFRSFLTKLVDHHETGKIFSVIAMVENIAPLLSSVIYANIYANTESFFAGFTFCIAAGAILVSLIIMTYVLVDSRLRLHQFDDQQPIVDNVDTAEIDDPSL